MPPPRKRVQACRQSAALSVAKRQRIQAVKEPEGEATAAGRSEIVQESDSEVEISDAEDDILKFTQPPEGWKEAERTAAGHSRANAGKTAQSRWYYKMKRGLQIAVL